MIDPGMRTVLRKAAFTLAAVMLNVTAGAQAIQKSGLTTQVEERVRVELRDTGDFSSTNGNDKRDYFNRLRVGLRWKDKAGWSAFLQPQFSYQEIRFVNGSHQALSDWDVHQGYAEATTGNWKWRAGRQQMLFGDARLIGNGEWNNIGRSFDGARFTINSKKTTTDLFATHLGQAFPKPNEPTFAGIYTTVTPSKKLLYDVYALYKAARLTTTQSQTILTFGARPKFVAGRFDGTFEAAFQTGSSSSRAVEAMAYAAVAGYTLPSLGGLRIAIERDYATGGNPNGTGTLRTFDNLFPTNHQHYGLMDYVGWRNMGDWRLSVKAAPTKKLAITLDGHKFTLADGTDFWYNDNTRPVTDPTGKQYRDPTGAAGRDLGTEVDITATYTFSPVVNLSVGVGRFEPGDFVKKVHGGTANAVNWMYVQSYLRY